MATRKIRTTIGRLVVIGSLALTLVAGTVAFNQPADVSAMPDLSECYASYRLGQMWQTQADIYGALGMYSQARLAQTIANSYFSVCGGGEEV
jgi:hypothetical protein